MSDEKSIAHKSHNVILENRQSAVFSGVVDVEGFCDTGVNLFTEGGALTVKGSGLHIVRLSLETGDVCVEGSIDSLVYSDRERRAGEGLFARIFR